MSEGPPDELEAAEFQQLLGWAKRRRFLRNIVNSRSDLERLVDECLRFYDDPQMRAKYKKGPGTNWYRVCQNRIRAVSQWKDDRARETPQESRTATVKRPKELGMDTLADILPLFGEKK